MANKSIGQFIAALRKVNGLTQQELADRLNVSNKAVSRWERDETAPDLSLIPALAELFDVTCDELLKGERIMNQAQTEKGDIKAERQLKALVNRALSKFKSMIWIALALSAIGLICMFGIAYGFFSPVIGFAVMLLFEAAAFLITVLAINRIKELETDNELFENIDPSLLKKCDYTLSTFSFFSFFAVFAVILLSLPLVFAYSLFIDSVMSFQSYLFPPFFTICLILAVAFLKVRPRYSAWITEQPYPKEERTSRSKVRLMDLLQLGSIATAGVLFILAPYFETEPNVTAPACITLQFTGLLLLIASIICFIVFMLKYRHDRKALLLPGIRNMLIAPFGLLLTEVHVYGFTTFDEVITADSVFEKYSYFTFEYLFVALAAALFLFLLFAFIEAARTKIHKK